MKDLIKKILKENDNLGWVTDTILDKNLPFTIGNPSVERNVKLKQLNKKYTPRILVLGGNEKFN